MRPQMLPGEIKIFEDALLSFGHHLDVLEWGSGGSTVYYTNFLKKHGIPYTWTSLEYNKEWYEKISAETQSDRNIKIVLFDVGNTGNKQREVNMDEYVNYPTTLNTKFDLIFVDGRKRRRCLVEAAQLLKPNGVVFLHDARRTYYHPAFRYYPDSRILTLSGLWKGKLEDPGFFMRLKNRMVYWGFRVYTFSFRIKALLPDFK